MLNKFDLHVCCVFFHCCKCSIGTDNIVQFFESFSDLQAGKKVTQISDSARSLRLISDISARFRTLLSDYGQYHLISDGSV